MLFLAVPNLPGVHGKQYACPVLVCSDPNSHCLHEILTATPTLAEYLPIPQSVQATADGAASVDDHLPLSQFSQSESFVLPCLAEYVPATHAVHAALSSFLAKALSSL